MTSKMDKDNLYQQDTDFEIIECLLPYLEHTSFIDIGAEKGTFTKFLSTHGMKGVFFEPLPKFAAELTALAQETQSTFLTYAIDETDRSADFYIASDHTDNPMDYFSSLHPLNDDSRIHHKKATTVTCRSLDSLLRDGLIEKEIGVLKVDTEGNDLNVLKGMHSVHADVLMCEYFMPGIYAGWELGHPQGLIDEAKKLGFHHFIVIKRINAYESVSVNNNAFIDKQWGNLIFAREPIFNAAKSRLDALIARKELALINYILEQTQKLNDTCEERLALIHKMDAELKRLKSNTGLLQNAMHKISNKMKTWFQ